MSAAPPIAMRLVEVVGTLEAGEVEAALRSERRERRRLDANWAATQAVDRNGGEP